MLFKIFVCFVVIAFACNVESFPIAMLVFFFSFPFSSLSFDKGLSLTFHDLLPKKLITKIGLIVLDKLKKVCVTDVFEDVICNVFDPCHVMCIIHRNQHSHPKNYEIENLGNKVENDREGSIVQGSEDGQIHLISRKVWRKIKVAQKKRLIDT